MVKVLKIVLWVFSLGMVVVGHTKNADNDRLAEANKMFAMAAASNTVPGISVAVADYNGVVWAEGFGFADLENHIKMTHETKLRIGSVAKVITTAGLMRQFENGLIDLNADIRKWVPEWPEIHDEINLLNLTQHTSGIRHYKGMEFFSNVAYKDSVDALKIFKDDDLLFKPGEKYSYSTYAWTVVSAIMERASEGLTFKQIINQEVIDPLGLTHTTFDDNAPIISNRHRPYFVEEGQLLNTPEVNSSYKYAGGGFLSTPSDVVKFAMAHTEAGYLKESTLKMMFDQGELSDGTENNIGIGWFVGFDSRLKKIKEEGVKNPDNVRIMEKHINSVMHSGGSMGGVTMMILCLEHEHAVTVVKNVSGDSSVDVFHLALKTLDLFYTE
ncbi:MAG: serine hydrolase domain-containing protein [Marinicella sp.]